MAVVRIRFAESAPDDPAGIQDWHAAEKAPEVGDRLVAELFQSVEVVATAGERRPGQQLLVWAQEIFAPRLLRCTIAFTM